jgi:hypothetical protein
MLLYEQTPHRVSTAAYPRNISFYAGHLAPDKLLLEHEGAPSG